MTLMSNEAPLESARPCYPTAWQSAADNPEIMSETRNIWNKCVLNRDGGSLDMHEQLVNEIRVFLQIGQELQQVRVNADANDSEQPT